MRSVRLREAAEREAASVKLRRWHACRLLRTLLRPSCLWYPEQSVII